MTDDGNRESALPENESLRARIAAAIHKDNGFGWSKYMCEEAADAVIRELNLAKACEGGCMWQIPNHVEDMTEEQRKNLEGWLNDV